MGDLNLCCRVSLLFYLSIWNFYLRWWWCIFPMILKAVISVTESKLTPGLSEGVQSFKKQAYVNTYHPCDTLHTLHTTAQPHAHRNRALLLDSTLSRYRYEKIEVEWRRSKLFFSSILRLTVILCQWVPLRIRVLRREPLRYFDYFELHLSFDYIFQDSSIIQSFSSSAPAICIVLFGAKQTTSPFAPAFNVYCFLSMQFAPFLPFPDFFPWKAAALHCGFAAQVPQHSSFEVT